MKTWARRQRGLSLLEVMVAVGILVAAVMLAAPIMRGQQVLGAEVATEQAIDSITKALESQYLVNSGWSDVADNRFLIFDDGTGFDSAFIPPSGGGAVSLRGFIPAPAQCRSMFQEPLKKLSGMADFVQGRGFSDPGVATLCFLVGGRRTAVVQGFRIPYHEVAVVSPGRDGVFHEATTYNFETGALALGGDDQGRVFSGRKIQEQKARQSMAQLERVRAVYEDYFTIRFMTDPARNVATNFFYADTGAYGGDALPGALARRTGPGMTLAEDVLRRVMGPKPSASTKHAQVSQVTLVSGWRTPVEVANYHGTVLSRGFIPSVRAPGGGAASAAPPWTAVLAIEIPGGGGDWDSHLVVTAMSRY